MRRTRDSLAREIDALFGLGTEAGRALLFRVVAELGYRALTMDAMRALADLHRALLDREDDRT